MKTIIAVLALLMLTCMAPAMADRSITVEPFVYHDEDTGENIVFDCNYIEGLKIEPVEGYTFTVENDTLYWNKVPFMPVRRDTPETEITVTPQVLDRRALRAQAKAHALETTQPDTELYNFTYFSYLKEIGAIQSFEYRKSGYGFVWADGMRCEWTIPHRKTDLTYEEWLWTIAEELKEGIQNGLCYLRGDGYWRIVPACDVIGTMEAIEAHKSGAILDDDAKFHTGFQKNPKFLEDRNRMLGR